MNGFFLSLKCAKAKLSLFGDSRNWCYAGATFAMRKGGQKVRMSWGIQCVRERKPEARYIFRVQDVNFRIPGGYDLIKETTLVVIILGDGAAKQIGEGKLTESNSRVLTWGELKELY